MTQSGREQVRVRFAPSPTGYLHIGGARTVLFNWLLARQTGGAFILRIEDTDRTRHVEDSVARIVDDLRWLGFDWDEGPEVGGDCGPYFQSQRLDIYHKHLQQLLHSGDAYYALETPEELAAMREAAEKAKGGFTYPRPHPIPTIEQGEAARAAGRSVVVRFKMPGTDITVIDDILGEVTLGADQIEDFVIQKSDGFPTYHFACVIDDALMRITHVLRGQEHLTNTPKHVAMQRALGFPTPRYSHLPVISNMDGSKMSKRDKEKAIKQGEPPPEIEVHDFRVAGYLPESIVNFIALLGWNPGDEREHFTLTDLIDVFSIERVGKTNARFDRQKLLSFNTDWAAQLPENRLLEAFKDYLAVSATSCGPRSARRDDVPASRTLQHARSDDSEPSRRLQPARPSESSSAAASRESLIYQPTGDPPTDDELRQVLRACAGFRAFPDVMKKAAFLLTPDDAIEYDAKSVKKVLAKSDGAGYAMLEYVLERFERHDEWTAPAMETLFEYMCAERDVPLGAVAQPVRVAITGSTISPSIHESLAMLGKESTLSRIRRCLSLRH